MTSPNPIGEGAREIADSLSNAAKRVMTHERFNPKGWEPGDPNGKLVCELIDAGLFVRRDGRCGFEAFKDSFIVPTKTGLAVRSLLASTQVTK